MKKLIFTSLMILLTIFALEVSSYAVYQLIYKKSFSYSDIAARQNAVLLDEIADPSQSISQPKTRNKIINSQALHPFFGFIQPPNSDIYKIVGRGAFTRNECQNNRQGFLSDFVDQDGLPPSSDSINIVITGGSVSHQFYCYSRKTLAEYLIKHVPQFKNKAINFIGLGMPSYKQPQQLIELSYYLSLGGSANIIINLDGLNEIVGSEYNRKHNVYPLYPFAWTSYQAKYSLEEVKTIGLIYTYELERQSLAHYFHPFDFTITSGLIWSVLDDAINKNVVNQTALLNNSLKKGAYAFSKNGPNALRKKKGLKKLLADHWYRSSTQMQFLATANGAQYFHFLQPNQYVKDSKIFSESEKRKAINDKFVGDTVRQGYDGLLDYTSKYKALGVNFFDLRYIYKNTEDTIYIDYCCHINRLGNDIMAEAIGKHIADTINAGTVDAAALNPQ